MIRKFIISLEAMLWYEYWNYFRARFGGGHAFGYNSADSEPIWMKSGALWIHRWGLALTQPKTTEPRCIIYRDILQTNISVHTAARV